MAGTISVYHIQKGAPAGLKPWQVRLGTNAISPAAFS